MDYTEKTEDIDICRANFCVWIGDGEGGVVMEREKWGGKKCRG